MTTILVASFAAGMVSTVNPCGFAMLPAYLGYFLGEKSDRQSGRLGVVVLSVASGFLVVFTIAGLLIGAGARAVVAAIPWLALVVGVGLVLVGVTQLLGKRLLPYFRGPGRARSSGSPGGMFVFGASYAVASLSCTLPIFLSLVTGAVATGSFGEAVLTFVAYGAGMAVVVTGLTVAVAAGRKSIVDRIRPLAARLDRISGWIMTGAGVFIIWYWATVLTVGSSALGRNPIVRTIDEWSATVTGLVADNPLLIGGGLLAGVVVFFVQNRRSAATEPTGESEPAGSARY